MLNQVTKFYKSPNHESHAHYDFTKLVGYDCVLEITPWHKGLSWKNIFEDIDWKDGFYDDPRINFSFLVYAQENVSWKSDIPDQLISPLVEFEEKHRVSMFPVLWVLSRSQSAIELFLSAPYLFWVIISSVLNSPMPEPKILSLFSEKRSNILKKLGFISSKSTLKFMSKLTYITMDKRKNETVWHFMEHMDYKSLNHLPMIHLSLVEFISHYPHLITARFIKTIKSLADISSFKRYLRDTYEMASQLNEPNSQQLINQCKSLDEVIRYHDRLSVRINHIDPKDIVFFEKSQLNNDINIHEILSNIDLRDEGIEMAHCIFSYAPRIVQQTYVAFKITAPERATLGIKMDSKGQYLIDQIQGKRNASVNDETREYIHQWLASQQ